MSLSSFSTHRFNSWLTWTFYFFSLRLGWIGNSGDVLWKQNFLCSTCSCLLTSPNRDTAAPLPNPQPHWKYIHNSPLLTLLDWVIIYWTYNYTVLQYLPQGLYMSPCWLKVIKSALCFQELAERNSLNIPHMIRTLSQPAIWQGYLCLMAPLSAPLLRC